MLQVGGRHCHPLIIPAIILFFFQSHKEKINQAQLPKIHIRLLDIFTFQPILFILRLQYTKFPKSQNFKDYCLLHQHNRALFHTINGDKTTYDPKLLRNEVQT